MPAKLPPSKMYSVHLPLAHIAEVHAYALREHRTPADFIRNALRQELERCYEKHGRLTDEQKTDLIERIMLGGRIADNGADFIEYAARAKTSNRKRTTNSTSGHPAGESTT